MPRSRHVVPRLLMLVVCFALVAGACGGDDDAASGAAGGADAGVADVLQVTSVDFTTGVAVIANTGDEPYDMVGHWICNRPSYAEIGDRTLQPGETADVSLGGFSADGGEVAIYSSSDFGSAEDIVTYVDWGAGGGRQGVAEAAGIWTGDPVIPTGDAIVLIGDPGTADGWE